MPRAARASVLLALLAAPALAGDGGKVVPGSYCKIPEEGQPAACLQPAQQSYSEFFSGLAQGQLSDEEARRVEADVAAGAGAPKPYEALSTLAYGYYRLAHAAAADPDADPEIVARLERWNALLAQAYATSQDDESYRAAVRAAAMDVRRRAPPVGLRCTDASGRPATCDSTEAVVRAMDDARDNTGVRGSLGRLIDRLFGSTK